jgi:hypothetical protein
MVRVHCLCRQLTGHRVAAVTTFARSFGDCCTPLTMTHTQNHPSLRRKALNLPLQTCASARRG